VVAEVGDVALGSETTVRTPGFGGTGGEREAGRQPAARPLGDRRLRHSALAALELRYESTNLQTYARQLDFFRVELAAMGGKREVDYAWDLAQATPQRRTGLPKQEKRLYMTWRGGRLLEFDRQLLRQAGIETSGRCRPILSAEVEQLLASLERSHAGNRSPKEFFKTVFGVRASGSGWEFHVIDQRFRSVY